ncbi:MAG TPA: glycosyltransferase family 87 protein [Candidatus Dormibacteraeota bacterium]|nr:glycosyltransferase family 87 protein [Candidatus Dormibacteraeota bacterium]
MSNRADAPGASQAPRHWRPALLLVITACAIATCVGTAYTFVLVPLFGHFAGEFEDFSAYSQAAHAVAAGSSPYATFDSGTIVMSGFIYPPFAAVLLRPLDFLSARWQEITWLWLSLGALVAGAVITGRALLPAAWPRARIAIIVALTFPPATYNLWHGQVNLVIFLLMAVALSDYLSGHRTRCGIVLGVAASIKLAPIVLLVVLARRGWWRAAAAGVATAAASVVVAVLALGWNVTHQYVSSVFPYLNRDNGWIYNQTWNGVISRLAQHSVLANDVPSLWVHALATALSVGTVAALWLVVSSAQRSRAERGAEFACGIVAMLLVGSIAWYPVYVHLLIALAAAAGLAYERAAHRRALTGWTVAALLGIGVVGAAVIASISMQSIVAISTGPVWWLFLQACSLPALLAAGLLVVMTRSLRGSTSSQPLSPRRDALNVTSGIPLGDRPALVP